MLLGVRVEVHFGICVLGFQIGAQGADLLGGSGQQGPQHVRFGWQLPLATDGWRGHVMWPVESSFWIIVI